MSGHVPRLVRGRVTRHEPYGFFVDIGEEQEGVVVLTMVSDDPRATNPPFPPIATVVVAVLLGYTDIGGQPRLSIRPADVRGCMIDAFGLD